MNTYQEHTSACYHLSENCPAYASWCVLSNLGLLKCNVKDRPRTALYDDAMAEARFRRWQRVMARAARAERLSA